MDLTARINARWELADVASRNGWDVQLPLPGVIWLHAVLWRDGVRLEIEWADDLEPTGCQVTIAHPGHDTITVPVCPHRSAQSFCVAYDAWRTAYTALADTVVDLDTIDLRGLT